VLELDREASQICGGFPEVTMAVWHIVQRRPALSVDGRRRCGPSRLIEDAPRRAQGNG
jgi:hypothetical protein